MTKVTWRVKFSSLRSRRPEVQFELNYSRTWEVFISVRCLFAYHSWMTDWSPIVIRLGRNADIDYRVKKMQKKKKPSWEDKQILVPLASCVDSGYCFTFFWIRTCKTTWKKNMVPLLCMCDIWHNKSRATVWIRGLRKEAFFFRRELLRKKSFRNTIDYKKKRM